MSVEKPNLWRVLSYTSLIIRLIPLHFLALSLLFIFLKLTLQPSSSHSHYYPYQYRLLSIFFLHAQLMLLIKLASSLQSIISSFFPLLTTRMAYFIIMVAITLSFGIWGVFVFLGLTFMGFAIDPTSKSFMAVVFVTTIPVLVMLVYLGEKWVLMEAVVVVENKYGFAPFQRSMNLVKGGRGLGLLMMMLLFALLSLILSGLMYSALGGGWSVDGGLVAYACLVTVMSLFFVGSKMVLHVYCKACIGELELPSHDKLRQPVYVQLSQDVVDAV